MPKTEQEKVREKLIEELMLVKGANQKNMFGYLQDFEAGYVADFILQRDKYILAPLVDCKKVHGWAWEKTYCNDAIDKTLQRAGIEV